MKSPITFSIKTELVPTVIFVISILLSYYFYRTFPDQVPTHWNIVGEPDDYSSKLFTVLLFPALIFGLYILFLLIPLIDPHKARYQEFSKIFHIFKNAILLFLLLVYVSIGLAGLNYTISISKVILGLVGALLIILGVYMPGIKQNWFIGIRTPWTLSSEVVWDKTHQLGGKMFILAGGLMALLALISPIQEQYFTTFIIFLVIVTAAIPSIYSYWLHLKITKNAAK